MVGIPLPLGEIKDDPTRYAIARLAQAIPSGAQTATVASAATVTVSNLPLITISGTADITSVTAGSVGQQVTLLFSGIAATNGVVDGSNLKLAGNFLYTADDTLTLISNGTNWYEIARSVN